MQTLSIHSAKPRLRIAAVSELTKVPEPTLRAWERRYGVPRPERSPSGYRHYGEADLEQIRAMHLLCEEGMPAAEAARIVLANASAKAKKSTTPDPYKEAERKIIDAVVRFDLTALEAELRELLFLGSAVAVLDSVLIPALRTIGEKWHAGEISVAHEHAATQKIGNFIRDLIRLLSSEDHPRTVLLAAFADEQHELSLLAVATRFAAWGVRPIVLGARTPPDAIREAVLALQPDLVGLSTTIAIPPARARELISAYASACEGLTWMVGGGASSGIAERVLAHGGIVAPNDTSELRALVTGVKHRAAKKRKS